MRQYLCRLLLLYIGFVSGACGSAAMVDKFRGLEDVPGRGSLPSSKKVCYTTTQSMINQEKRHPMKVDLHDVEFSELNSQVRQAVSSSGVVSLNLSGRKMHDDGLELLIASLHDAISLGSLNNIVEIDLSDNELSVEGLQSLLPIIASQGFMMLNISGNRVEGEDLFEKLGTDAAYGEYVLTDGRVILDQQTRQEVLKKIVWMSRAYFDPLDPQKNPQGVYVTPEVIQRHRVYYGMES